MILRVSIDNLVIVRSAAFEPGPGMTAVTGETGAGKTLLATAIGLLFGSDAGTEQVGEHGDQAWVEGEFAVDEKFWADPSVAALAELRPSADENVLVLARKISGEGRTRALAWGRGITKIDLVAAGRLLVASAGQHAHRRLLSPAYQRELLDGSGDPAHNSLVEQAAAAWRDLQAARAQHEQVHRDAAELATRAEQIRDALERIDAVEPSVEDEAELITQRDRTRHRAALCEALAQASTAVAGDDTGAAIDAVGTAWSAVHGATDWDATLTPLAVQLRELQDQLGDVASDLRGRLEDLSDAPAASEQVEERLSAYDELKRHLGGTTEAVLIEWQRLRQQVDLLTGTDAALAAVDERLRAAQEAAHELAARLTSSRTKLAKGLAKAVTAELSELAMVDSTFDVTVEPTELAATGADRVEMRLAPHARAEPRPISQVASGGELSRLALALNVATGASEASTLIFDEIDAGIGGNTGHAIGRKLAQLAQRSQVICITHLAQVAARADTHVVISKSAGETTLSTLADDEATLDELCRMVGADPADVAARTHAQNLRGERFKRTRGAPAQLSL